MWEVLAILGVSIKLIHLVKQLLDGSLLHFKVGIGKNGDVIVIECETGAKQGLTFSPTLFLFVFHAMMLTIQWPAECRFPNFRARMGGALPCD